MGYRAALISLFIVGGGQIYSGRIWTGIWLAIIFYGTIAIMAIIWTGINQAFWSLILAWLMVWLYNILDAYKGPDYDRPPCERNCPAGMPSWIYLNFLATKSEQLFPFWPFYRTLGFICPAPCEDHCTRRAIDQSLAIRYLKLFIKVNREKPKKLNPKFKIAVVGAGPSGLSCAYRLATRGYRVTIYERENRPGGILAHFLPQFRLPNSILEQDINDLLLPEIELKLGAEVGKDIKIEDLLKIYDRIYLATGAWEENKLGIPGEEKCLKGLAILRLAKNGEILKFGKVGVIGGGNTAFDVARTLRRFDNEVTIFYRRRIEDMPAEHENIAEARAEGVEIEPLTLPIKIEGKNVRMTRTELIEGKPVPVTGSEFDVQLDRVVIAIGQSPNPYFLKDIIRINNSGWIEIKGFRTSHPRIYAGGDLVLGAMSLAHAVGQGMRAAEAIDFDLRHIPPIIGKIFKQNYFPKVKVLPDSRDSRIVIPTRPIGERIRDFNQVELSTSGELICKEAGRCLTCPLKYRA